MSLAPTAAMPGQRAPSPTNGNFASNNPFRRAASPALPSPDESYRPRMANNPFLDPPAQSGKRQQNPFGEDLFKDLSLVDKSGPGAVPQVSVSRAGTVPVQHRPVRSQEEDARRRLAPPRGPPRSRDPQQTLDIFASPPKVESRRPRRNSESSVMDRDKTEDDRRRRERRKEREARREKDGKSRESKSKPKKPQGLDIIDKLDVTGIYGPGLFHHDGPFDACNPHRNRKKDVRAPMQAFPAGSANNALGGSGPLNRKLDLDRFHGRGEDAFNDFAASRAVEPGQKTTSSFNPAERVEQLHGSETEGLGTSTFLEGAPASRKDVQRRESETDPAVLQGGGLGRKKSLAVRLRGLSQNRRDVSADRVHSPDARYNQMSPNSPGQTVQSAGGPSKTRFAPGQEKNPFFTDYDDAYEKKGAQITAGRVRAPSSPRGNGLVRSITADSAAPGAGDQSERGGGGGGFLSRMKSLKGGRRARPERRES